MLRPGRLLVVVAFLFFAPSAQAAITAMAKPAEIKYGQSTTVSGKAAPGATVQLRSTSGPAYSDERTADPVSGDYEFADLKPGSNTTYRLSTTPDDAQSVKVVVDEVMTSKITPLGLGQMRLKLTSRHPSNLKWGKRRVYVFVAQGSQRFKLVARARTSQKGELTRLTADFPVSDAGKFTVYSCFDAPGDHALGAPDQHSACHHHSFVRKTHKLRHRSIQAFEKNGFAPVGY